MFCKNGLFSMLCLAASVAGTVFGMMLFFKNTKKGRRLAKKARRIGKDMEELLSF